MEFDKLYFYTSTIRNWIPILRDHNLEPIIVDSLNFLYQKGCIKLYGFVIMPNHMHLILEQLKLNGKEKPIASLMKYTAHCFEKFFKGFLPSRY
jgi:REP-associated tyrosine transposase